MDSDDGRLKLTGTRNLDICGWLPAKNQADLVESKAGASKPEILTKTVPTPGPGDNHPFLSRNLPRRENGSLPRNVCSTGSGPQPQRSCGVWRVGPVFGRFCDVNAPGSRIFGLVRPDSASAKPIDPTRGLRILLARISRRYYTRIYPLCHYFARDKNQAKNESNHV